MKTKKHLSPAELCSERLKEVSAAPSIIDNFLRLYDLVAKGVTGVIEDESIEPVKNIPTLEELERRAERDGGNINYLNKLVVCKLNGGLGTSMGLKKAKSLLRVRYDAKSKRRLSFNEVNARQIEMLGEESIPFVNMVSFSTADDVKRDLTNSALRPSQLLLLKQNIHPKILAETLVPAQHEDDSMCWNPPGHGDFYQAFYASGMLQDMLKAGKKYLFISNADNLSAYPSQVILNYVASQKVPFLMEVTRRTESDKKGGHLARRKSDGRIILRESAQAPHDEHGQIIGDFQDVERHSCFNINSMWIDLEVLANVMQQHDGIVPLALIRNQKTLDPRDASSPQVFQIETAMGAAIEFFEGAQLLEVGRERFAPVKTCSDLLAVLSDCFELDRQGVLTPQVNPLPYVSLSSEYKLIDDFENLFPQLPSLLSARKFSVSGNVRVNSAVKIIGSVAVVDVRSDRGTAVEMGADCKSFADVRLTISDEGQSYEAMKES